MNGPLLEKLSQHSGHCDQGAADLFRVGAPIYGKLPATGIGTAVVGAAHDCVSALHRKALKQNRALLKNLRPDEFEDALAAQISEEVALGRVSAPRAPDEVDLSKIVLSPRFGIHQGYKSDGAPKIRAIDDFTRSGINACTAAQARRPLA